MRNANIYEQLLEEWQNKYVGQDFVKDGIMNSDSWNEAPCKILFILKESYHKKNDKGPWDMRELGDYGKPFGGKTFLKTAYLAYLLIQLASGKPLKFPRAEEKQKVDEAFIASAIINVKKPVGNSSSENLNLINYAKDDAKLLQRQIELIDPQIIVCGGTWGILNSTVFVNPDEIADRVWKTNLGLVIDFWHPGTPATGEMMFNAFCWIANQGNIVEYIVTK
ncbi:hypothetical protein ACFL36_01390 [Thermodesulfobacteriota bacterium]